MNCTKEREEIASAAVSQLEDGGSVRGLGLGLISGRIPTLAADNSQVIAHTEGSMKAMRPRRNEQTEQ